MNMAAPLASESVNGMRIDWDVPIPMDDGTVLRADVFRPDDNRKYPVIMGATPYAKWLSFQDEVWGGQWKMLTAHEPDILKLSSNKYQNYEFPDPERFVPDGYVLIRVDVRGTGRSPGLMDLLSERETKDFHDCIEWAAVQPWANGRVGLSGVSYLAMNQWQVAALKPPHLSALCIWEGCSDYYREFTRHGGILSLFGDLWIDKYAHPVQHGLGTKGFPSHILDGEWVSGPETLDQAALERSRRDWRVDIRDNKFATDKFWTSRYPDFSRIDVPLLSSANWGGQGLHLRGNIEGFQQAASRQKWLDFHCLEHWTEFYTKTGVALQKRFFAHFLKDEDNGWGQEPRVQMQVRHPTAPFTHRTADAWPLPETQWTKMYLDPAALSLESEPAKSESKISFPAQSDGVTFLSAPLTKERKIIGPSALKMFVSSSSDDADIFVVLRVFSPDMREVTFSGSNDPHTPMAHGWLRASFRKLDRKKTLPYRPYHTFDEKQPLAPSKPYELDIEIWPTCIVVPAGYRIGLSIRGKDYVYPGDLSGVPGKIGQPATGVGPFRHTDAVDRPATITTANITLWSEDGGPGFVTIPFVD